MTTVPVDVTVPNLQMYLGTILAICQQEIGRAPDYANPGDPVGAIMLNMALFGSTGDDLRLWLHEQPEAVAYRSKPALPPPPTREQACRVNLTFQGLTVTLPGYGTIPWFEPFLASLDAAGRQVVYAAKHAQGDTHAFLSLSYNYQEADYHYPVPGADFAGDLPAFVAIVRDVIVNGFIPVVSLSADGQAWNPEGWTHGWQFGMDNMASIISVFQADGEDLTAYCPFMGGYELLGPGGNWTDTQVEQFYLKLRSLLPNGYIALELGQGYCKWMAGVPEVDGPTNWQSPTGQAIDIFLQEFPQPINDGDHWDGCQQLASAMLGPAAQNIAPKNRLSWYVARGTPRGPVYVCAFEYALYNSIRGGWTDAQVNGLRAQLRSLGYVNLG